jgi:hypothetical protein
LGYGLWMLSRSCGFSLLVVCCVLLAFCCVCRLSFWSRCFGKLLFLAISFMMSHSFYFLSGFDGKECILVMWDLNAAIFCSIGWLERKLIVVSVVVGFLYMSMSSFVCWRLIVKSRKFMDLCSSYVGLRFMLLCNLFMCVLIIRGLIFVLSNMIKMSSTYRTWNVRLLNSKNCFTFVSS